MEAHGGLIASAAAVARFTDAYQMNGVRRTNSAGTDNFQGSLPGTYTVAMHRSNGVSIVALLNRRLDDGLDYLIKDVMDAAADQVNSWNV